MQGLEATENLRFYDINLYMLYAFDLSELLERNALEFLNDNRGSRSWLESIELCFRQGKTSFHVMKLPPSEFKELTKEVKEKIPFSDYFLSQLMPLSFRNDQSPNHLGDEFEVVDQNISLYPDGALTIRFQTRQRKQTGTLRQFRTDEINVAIRKWRDNVNEFVVETLGTFRDDWNSCVKEIKLQQIDLATVRMFRYEIVLFDYDISTGKFRQIKELYKKENFHLLKELVGFTRMSLPQSWMNLSDDFLAKFQQKDLGNRSDELWLVHKNRFLRYHPMRRDPLWEKWFNDFIRGIEVLLAKKAALEFINTWAEEQLALLRTAISDVLAVKSEGSLNEALKGASERLSRITNLISLIDPPKIAGHVIDEFYQKIMMAVLREQEIENLLRISREHSLDLYRLNETLRSIVTFELQTRVLRAIRGHERWLVMLTAAVVTLTVVLILLR